MIRIQHADHIFDTLEWFSRHAGNRFDSDASTLAKDTLYAFLKLLQYNHGSGSSNSECYKSSIQSVKMGKDSAKHFDSVFYMEKCAGIYIFLFVPGIRFSLFWYGGWAVERQLSNNSKPFANEMSWTTVESTSFSLHQASFSLWCFSFQASSSSFVCSLLSVLQRALVLNTKKYALLTFIDVHRLFSLKKCSPKIQGE